MDPKMIEKRRLIRLKAKPKLPRKNLYLWRPSEEFEDYSDLKTESSVSETKQTASEENKKNKQKKLKRSKKSRKISKNSEKSIKSSKNPKLDSSSPKISSKFSEKQISQEINISEKAHFEAQTVKAKPFIGPMPLVAADSKIKGYGCGLYHGEGEAIASFVQKGIRIPRRGEIGLTSNEIQKFENLGYVMSGSRNKRMNAIRIRKENQVYSAEEKQALTVINLEEKLQKEQRVIADMRNFLKSQTEGDK